MRKDITKKFLGKEDRYAKKMLSKDISIFIVRNKIKYDEIEFRNVFSTEFMDLDTNNILKSGYKIRKIVSKNDKSIEFNMVYCESGFFKMNSDSLDDNSLKNSEMIERSFWLGEIEITQELYKLVMGRNPSYHCDKNSLGKEYYYELGDTSKHPIENISWYDAIDFCNKLSSLQGLDECYHISEERRTSSTNRLWGANMIRLDLNANGFRLPSSKEWEYAARAGTNNQWSGTNDKTKLGEYAWFSKNSNDETHPVATKKPNEWGFYDMSGNVSELCHTLNQKIGNFQLVAFAFDSQIVYCSTSYCADEDSLMSTRRNTQKANEIDMVVGFRIASFF